MNWIPSAVDTADHSPAQTFPPGGHLSQSKEGFATQLANLKKWSSFRIHEKVRESMERCLGG